MSFLKALVFIFFAGSVIVAQQISFCKSVSAEGKPVEQKSVWELKSGSAITILFDNSKPIESSMVYMFIDRMVAGNYEAYDSKAISTEKSKKTITYAYSFTESGNYSVYFINNSGQRLAQGQVTVRISEKRPVEKAPAEVPTEKAVLNTDIVFCEKVVSNKPVNPNVTFSLKNGGNVTIYIKSEEPFNTNSIIVHIYKKKKQFNRRPDSDKKIQNPA